MIQGATKNQHLQAKEQHLKKVRAIAEGWESNFAKTLLKKMDSTVGRTEQPSVATNIYKDMLQTEYAKIISQQNGGLGIKTMIEKELLKGSSYNQAQYQIQKMASKQAISKYQDGAEEDRNNIAQHSERNVQMHKNNTIKMGSPYQQIRMNKKESAHE